MADNFLNAYNSWPVSFYTLVCQLRVIEDYVTYDLKKKKENFSDRWQQKCYQEIQWEVYSSQAAFVIAVLWAECQLLHLLPQRSWTKGTAFSSYAFLYFLFSLVYEHLAFF